MKYKIIQEYSKYYLAQSEKGYKECFSKCEKGIRYKITEDNFIIKIKTKEDTED